MFSIGHEIFKKIKDALKKYHCAALFTYITHEKKDGTTARFWKCVESETNGKGLMSIWEKTLPYINQELDTAKLTEAKFLKKDDPLNIYFNSDVIYVEVLHL